MRPWKRPSDEGEAMVIAIKLPIRRRILAAMADGPTSPRSLDARFGEDGLQRIAYHVRLLSFLEVIELADRRPVRGSTEHFYRLNDLGRRALALAEATGMLDKRGS